MSTPSCTTVQQAGRRTVSLAVPQRQFAFVLLVRRRDEQAFAVEVDVLDAALASYPGLEELTGREQIQPSALFRASRHADGGALEQRKQPITGPLHGSRQRFSRSNPATADSRRRPERVTERGHRNYAGRAPTTATSSADVPRRRHGGGAGGLDFR